MGGDTGIKVGCRMRPFIAREKGEEVAFNLTGQQVNLKKDIDGLQMGLSVM